MGIFCVGKNAKPSGAIDPPILIHYITLNLNISASRQDIKILLARFWAIYVRILHDKFQLSSFKTVGENRGYGQSDAQGTSRHFAYANF